jgi:hypothetical protein
LSLINTKNLIYGQNYYLWEYQLRLKKNVLWFFSYTKILEQIVEKKLLLQYMYWYSGVESKIDSFVKYKILFENDSESIYDIGLFNIFFDVDIFKDLQAKNSFYLNFSNRYKSTRSSE